jgi:hypothetical protein
MSTPTGSDHLVLEAATSYELAEITPFVRSLRRTGHAGHVALLVDALRPESRQALHGMGVELVTVAEPWQTLSRSRQRLRRTAARLRLPALWYATSRLVAVREVPRIALPTFYFLLACEHFGRSLPSRPR